MPRGRCPLVLHIIPQASYGSTASTCELSLALASRGVDVRVLALSLSQDTPAPGFARLEQAGVPIDRLAIRHLAGWMHPKPLYRLGDLLAIRRAVGRLAPDLIHCHGILGLAGMSFPRRYRPGPTVVTLHGDTGRRPMYEALFRRLSAGAAARIVLTRRDLPSGGSGTVLLRNGIDVQWWARAAEQATDLRDDLSIPAGVPVVGLVGRLSPEKGAEPFLHAFADRGALRDAHTHLLIAGDGPLEHRLRCLCDRLDIARFVRFIGRRFDMPRVYRTADLVVLPSLRETQPMVILEALACGVPVIATAAGGVPTMLADGAGRVVPIGDYHTMLSAIENLIASSGEHDSLVRRGRLRVESAYSAADLARQIVDTVYAQFLP
jgi:glycosyltransferase involved in cell wall biosynthesis